VIDEHVDFKTNSNIEYFTYLKQREHLKYDEKNRLMLPANTRTDEIKESTN